MPQPTPPSLKTLPKKAVPKRCRKTDMKVATDSKDGDIPTLGSDDDNQCTSIPEGSLSLHRLSKRETCSPPSQC